MSDERDPHASQGEDSHQAGADAGGPGGAQARDSARAFTEEFKVAGETVVTRVKELVREGNVRRIIIKNEEGRVLMEFPLTFGVIGSLLLPQLAALGAIAGLIANLTIAVERRADPGGQPEPDAPGDDAPHT